MPDSEPGMRIEPPPSEPCAIAVMPAATATAAPPLEPPGVRAGSHGLRAGPVTRFSVVPLWPCSGVLVLPTMMPPAARTRSVHMALDAAIPSSTSEPCDNLKPSTASRSLIGTGMPCRGPRSRPSMTTCSASRAAVMAWSAMTVTNPPSDPSSRSMRSSVNCISSTGDSRRVPIRSRRTCAGV